MGQRLLAVDGHGEVGKCADEKLQIEDFHGWSALSRSTWRADRHRGKGEHLLEGPRKGQRQACRERPKDSHHGAALLPVLTYYLCEDAIQSSRNSQYSGWQIAGLLVRRLGMKPITGGSATTSWRTFRLSIREVAYDPWQAPPLMQEIQARDDWDPTIPMVEIKPTVQNFSPAMKELEGAIYGGRFHHNGDPILEWMISNVVCKRDNKDNIYPAQRAGRKQD
jgi:hypothetical protein